jgi:hypothetical protein
MARIDIWDAQPIFCWAITALVFVAEVATVIGVVIVIKEILNGIFK